MSKRKKSKRNFRLGSPANGGHSSKYLRMYYGEGAKPDAHVLSKIYSSQDWHNAVGTKRDDNFGLIKLEKLVRKHAQKFDLTYAAIYDANTSQPIKHWTRRLNRWVNNNNWLAHKGQQLPKSMLRAWVCYNRTTQFLRKRDGHSPNQTLYSTDPYRPDFKNIELKLRYAVNSREDLCADLDMRDVDRIWVYLVAPDARLTDDPKGSIGSITNGYFIPTSKAVKQMLMIVNEAAVAA